MRDQKEGNKLKLREHLTDCLAVLMLTVFLYCFNSGGYLSIVEAKRPFFFAFCGGYILFGVIIWGWAIAGGERKPIDPRTCVLRSSWTQRFVILYWVLTIISALLSQYPKAAWFGETRAEGALTISIYCGIYFVASCISKPKKWIVYVLAASLLVQSVLCIVQFSGANPLNLYPRGVNYYDANILYEGAFLGTIGNIDLMGAFFCASVPLLLVFLYRAGGAGRFLLLIPLAVVGYVIVRMQVWSCIVGILCGMILAIPVVLRAEKRVRLRTAFLITGAVITALAFFYFVPVAGIFGVFHRILHGDIPPSLESGRLYIWSEVLQRVKEHFWFGTGPDTMSFADIHFSPRYREDLGVTIMAGIDVAHSEYLNILFHQGFPAMLAYMAALLSALISWVRRSRASDAVAVVGAAVLCYAIQALFNISMYITAPFFWLELGYLDAACQSLNPSCIEEKTLSIKM